MNAAEALGEAWASIDGKLEAFRRERDENIALIDPRCTGHYEGYLAEAEEMIRRLDKRGFVLVPIVGRREDGMPITRNADGGTTAVGLNPHQCADRARKTAAWSMLGAIGSSSGL